MHPRVRRLFAGLRTEGAGAAREAAAIGVGVFIGCLPFYGFHLLMCWVAGWFLRLNRLKVYVAANISNPFFAPTLLFVELQLGAWLRRGAFHPLTIETARTTGMTVFGIDILFGSVVLGAALGGALTTATYFTLRGSAADEIFLELVRRATDRYVETSITAWEFARGKLRGDPLYRAAVCGAILPSGGTLVDVGCGQGLTLALLAEARRAFREGWWPAGPPPPEFDRMIGIETRPRVAKVARFALAADAQIVEADARTWESPPCRVMLFFDVLHMMPAASQEELIAASAARLEPGGVMLVREADASAGWRFTAVRLGNRFKALAFGAWRQPFHFRTAEDWVRLFASHGLLAEVRPMGEGTPFGNVLLRVSAQAHASAATRRPSQAL
jgi:uncharacterized protein (DUF2062 family)